ncbi:hypothetical protein Tco_1502093 [Tanacetum coccineum]
MKESKAYNTYLSYATGTVPPKKGKRVKRAAKKPSTTPAASIVIREPTVETQSKRKEKQKEARIKEVRKKRLRDFHKTHPSGSGTVAEDPPSVAKITPTVTSEGNGDKPRVLDLMNDDSSESESESWGNDEDDSNEEKVLSDEGSEQEIESEDQASDSEQDEESEDDDQEEEEFVHTPSPTDDNDDDDLESESDDVTKSDEEKGIDDAKEILQREGADTKMHDAQQEDENLVSTQEQVIEDAHVTISTVIKKTEVPVTSSSRSSDLATKSEAPTLLSVPRYVIPESSPILTNIPQSSHTFTPTPIQTTPTPPPTIETSNPLSPLLDFSSVFQFNDRITTLEKEVAELKKEPLHTQVTSLVDSHLDTRLGETREEFMNFLSESLTARIKEQVRDQLPQILPQEVSTFVPPVIEKMIEESRNEVILAKVSSQPPSSYEAVATLTEFELKKILIDKIEKSESYLTAPQHRECYDRLKKSYELDMDYFSSYNVYSLKRSRQDKDKDEDPSARSDRGLKKRKRSRDVEPTGELKKKDSTSGSSKSQSKSSGKSVQSEEPVFEIADSDMPQDQEGNLGDDEDEPRKETTSRHDWFKKPAPSQEPTDPDWNTGKTTQEGPTQKHGLQTYDSLLFNVAYDKYALWGISHWREQRKSFYSFARGMQSRGDVYSTKWILAVTHVSIMRKHGYGYLEEIIVRRADNDLYRFKEGDKVADFAIALRNVHQKFGYSKESRRSSTLS